MTTLEWIKFGIGFLIGMALWPLLRDCYRIVRGWLAVRAGEWSQAGAEVRRRERLGLRL